METSGYAKRMNHAEYQKRCRAMNREQLEWIIVDAKAAIIANPNGENAGYYMDEIHYATAELKKRKG